jgi:hypothetical protein
MECVLETKAEMIFQFIHGLRGSLQVTLEEGTCAAWLHDLLKAHVTHLRDCAYLKTFIYQYGYLSSRVIDCTKRRHVSTCSLVVLVPLTDNAVSQARSSLDFN